MSGKNGKVLWEKPAAKEVEWMQCGIRQLGEASEPGCLVVGKPASLTALSQTGEWQGGRCWAQGTVLASLTWWLSDLGNGEHQHDMTRQYVDDVQGIYHLENLARAIGWAFENCLFSQPVCSRDWALLWCFVPAAVLQEQLFNNF